MRQSKRTLAYGTGFVVLHGDLPYLVTAGHNLRGRHWLTGALLDAGYGTPDNLIVYHTWQKELATYYSPRIEPLYDEDGPLWRTHPDLPVCDVVALPLTRLIESELRPYAVADIDWASMIVGDPVNIVGYPYAPQVEAGNAVTTRGYVASEPTFEYGNNPIYLIDCRAREGQSGSPVRRQDAANEEHVVEAVSADGSTRLLRELTGLVGVYSGRLSRDSDLGIAWKPNVVAEVLAGSAHPGRYRDVPEVPNFASGSVAPRHIPGDPYDPSDEWE